MLPRECEVVARWLHCSVTINVGLRSERGPILIALMLTTFLVAIEATVLSTAVPSIVADLGDFPLFPWLFSVYLLAQAVTVPVYAKLADTVGRKPIILIGIGLFLLGSILSAFAWSMPALIAFRVIQGLGAGAVLPISITIAGDIYTVEERAKVQGYLASMWAVASVVGPTLGGLFAQFDAWRGIFIVNIPLCLLAAWMLTRTFHEKITRTAHRIDYAGAVLLTVALTALLLAVLEGGQAWAWNSLPSILLFGGGALVLVAFLLVERRAAEPILPLWVFTRRLVLVVSIFGLGIGATLTGLTSYVPLYLQGALGVSPLIAGFALATLTVGWPIAAAVSGRLYLRIGFRNTMFIGMGLVLVGAVLLAAFAMTPSILVVAVSCFFVGLGMGLAATPSLILAQSSVGWNERGVVTGVNMFARNVGSAVGVAVFGAIANSIFLRAGADSADPAVVTAAGSAVFIAALVVAVATLIATIAMPRTRVQQLPAEETDLGLAEA